MSSRLRLLLACLATAALVGPLGWMWWSSLMPDQYSVMDMGYVDLGGGPDPTPASAHGGTHGSAATGESVDISTLVEEQPGRADVRIELTARAESFRPESGEEVEGYTLNGSSPGPTIRATEGDVVEAVLTNDNITAGVTLHWHGVDVPNAMDGVAGVTQDAVAPGESFTYRFVAEQVGTYWYHSHQVSHEQVRRGLFGTLVVTAREGIEEDVDAEAVVHTFDGQQTVNGRAADDRVEAQPGDVVRVRAVNTDNVPMTVWVSGADYRVVAVDGYAVNEPGSVSGKAVLLTAGGRVDLRVVVPASGARVELGEHALVLGPDDAETSAVPEELLDLLSYGAPADLGFDPSAADRRFEYAIGRRPGFLDGRPGMWWTVNGRMWPDVPMYTVAEGDVVVMRIGNDSGDVHPMHLHGHHAVVLSRNGEPATGSPWWVDSLDVQDGETYEIAFLADNPGVWMDHCHNLPHAAEGLVAHLMYAGYDTPFRVGGAHHNEPE